MNTTIKGKEDFEWPTGSLLTMIGKQYSGALSFALESCGADRYFSILLYLHHCNKPIKQQLLVDKLRIDKASMVRMLDYLVERNLLKRTVNPVNRREYLVELSPAGKRKVPRIRKEIDELDNLLFEGVSPVARKKFFQTLKQLATNMDNLPERPASLSIKLNTKSSC